MDKKISVLMGIYNCADTLRQAVASIQAQTYTNWELILCDDCSTDDTYSVAEALKNEDSRILLIRNQQNMGLNVTLNRCLALATGELIARMDGDDDCVPERFAHQVQYLETHPEFQIVSSAMVFFDENGEWGKTIPIPMPTREAVVTRSPICHAPVMMYKSCMDAVHGYTEDRRMLRVEDVDLWIKLYAAGYRCYNLQEPLYRMRNDQNAMNRRKYRYRLNSTYVRLRGCKMMKLGWKCYVKSFTPMIVGLIPSKCRRYLRQRISGRWKPL